MELSGAGFCEVQKARTTFAAYIYIYLCTYAVNRHFDLCVGSDMMACVELFFIYYYLFYQT